MRNAPVRPASTGSISASAFALSSASVSGRSRLPRALRHDFLKRRAVVQANADARRRARHRLVRLEAHARAQRVHVVAYTSASSYCARPTVPSRSPIVTPCTALKRACRPSAGVQVAHQFGHQRIAVHDHRFDASTPSDARRSATAASIAGCATMPHGYGL